MKFEWKSKAELDKIKADIQEEIDMKTKYQGKSFHELTTPEKWELLEIIAKNLGYL